MFLDEIGDLSPNSQVKLLRLLQEGEYYPIGSDQPKRIQARVIVATHHDLLKQQQLGKFRKDLYYRLCTHMVTIPPLRDRLNDLPMLVDHFVQQACDELNKLPLRAPQKLATQLQSHHFPGNVRELRALIYDAVSQSQHGELNMQLFTFLTNNQEDRAFTSSVHFDENTPLPTLSQLSAILVEAAMLRANNNQSLAARMLGISQPALSKRLKNMKTQSD